MLVHNQHIVAQLPPQMPRKRLNPITRGRSHARSSRALNRWAAAREQAGTYFDALPERDRPRYQPLWYFQTFELLVRDEREETRFALADLPRHVQKFGFIVGVQRRTFRDQNPVNIDASELIARQHDALSGLV